MVKPLKDEWFIKLRRTEIKNTEKNNYRFEYIQILKIRSSKYLLPKYEQKRHFE